MSTFEYQKPAKAYMEASDNSLIEFCPDTGAGLSLIRASELRHYPRAVIRALDKENHMEVNGIGSKPISSTRIVQDFPFTLPSVDGEKVRLYGTVHVVDRLPVPCIIGNNILAPNGVNIMYEDVPGDYPALRVKGHYIRLHVTPVPRRKRMIFRARASTIIYPGEGINLRIRHNPLPRCPEGYMFFGDPIHDMAIGTYGKTINCLYNGNEDRIPFANLGLTNIHIHKGQTLGYIEQAIPLNRKADVYLSLDHIFQGLPIPTEQDEPDDPPAGLPFVVQPPDDDAELTTANVSSHWGEDYERRVREVLQKHYSLFRKELGRFNDDVKMPIPFRENADLSRLKQAPYVASKRDEEAMDSVLDPLVQQGRVKKVPLGQPSAAASPAFVVWKNDKPRVVIDMRRVNCALYPDAYPLPKQDTILGAMGGATIFSSLDFVKSFFQQDIVEADQWKTAFVSSHRGHEMFTVSTMGLANSPGFFQHRMEELFSRYLWDFILVYVDDIIIFSRTLEDHLLHLDRALTLLENAGVTLSISKCHFGFPSIQALGHYVSRLGLSTVQEKTEAIRNMTFPTTLRTLEFAIGFFGFYRKFVPEYAYVSEPLVNLKTRGFKDGPKKGYERQRHAEKTLTADFMDQEERLRCEAAFEELKSRLCNAPVLAHPDFKRDFILYVDGSREKGFGVAVHQMDISDPEKPINRPVLYLSKTLSPAETRYWPTELETAALVWALKKLPQYTDGKFLVYTDHSAIVSAFKDDGPVKGKRSERLQSWRLFLARYAGRMEIQHVPGKDHLNADGLSRLQSKGSPPPTEALLAHSPSPRILLTPTSARSLLQTQSNLSVREPRSTQTSQAFPLDASYKAELIQMNDDFRERLVAALPLDPALKKVYNAIQKRATEALEQNEIPLTTRESFRVDLDSGLMYQMAPDGRERLCIPKSLHRELLETAHDNCGHIGHTRTCERIRQSIYLPHLRKLAAEYIHKCPVCNACRPSTQLPAGELKPIVTPFIPFYAVAMDFIVGLPPTTNDFDCILTITDKATKYVKLIPGKTKGDAFYWAIRFWDYVATEWGLPKSIISDRDGRFLSKFWQALFKKVGTTLAMTTAYHPQADGQSEKTNQTVEIMLRCMIANHDAPMVGWDELLPDVQFAVNTARNGSTGESPAKLLYGVHLRDGTNAHENIPADDESAEQFYRSRQDIRLQAEEALKLAQAKMAIAYDIRHSSIKIGDLVYLKLTRKLNRGYRIPHSSALDIIKDGPFRVLEKISGVAFRLDLPPRLKIHPVISIAHLEPAQDDPYNRTPIAAGRVIESEEEEIPEAERRYIVDRILAKELRKMPGKRTRQWHYKVRWQGYDASEDSWVLQQQLEEDVPEIVAAWERHYGPRIRRSFARKS